MAKHLDHARHELVASLRATPATVGAKKTLKGGLGELLLISPVTAPAASSPMRLQAQTRWTGFDVKILPLYARDMTVREIQGHLEE